MSQQDGSGSTRTLNREDWVAAARKMLIEKGISGIRLRSLSESLNATTGAFYWQYRKLEELFEDLRLDWARVNSDPFTRAIEAAGSDGMRQYLAYVRVLVLDGTIDPRYDNAIRDWAHSSPRTAEILKEIEIKRIDQLTSVFQALGFEGKAAVIRARVTYFHQTGYNAMQITETVEERLSNLPYYAEVLTDRKDLHALKGPDEIRTFLLAGGFPDVLPDKS
ncbi:MAG: TetR/AcrR family transcriptional regulator [Alphaproteobacteria bacterium]|nr:TetR/AcrR family transcriptional regulator [Alphaproteobacteria bacterium]